MRILEWGGDGTIHAGLNGKVEWGGDGTIHAGFNGKVRVLEWGGDGPYMQGSTVRCATGVGRRWHHTCRAQR